LLKISDDEDFSSEAEASGDLFLPIDGPITETEKPYKEYEEIENEFIEEIEIRKDDGVLVEKITETIVENIGDESLSETEEISASIPVPIKDKETRTGEIEVEQVESEGSWIEGRHVMAGLIGGGAAGVLFATLFIILCIHRIKKKDEGSYSIADQARYQVGYKPTSNNEVYA